MLSIFSGQYLIWLALIIGVCLIVIGLIVFLVIKKKKSGHIRVDAIFIRQLINNLGGESNIEAVEVEQSRLKFKVKDITLADLEGIKSASLQGVFVSGNNIKTLFKYESEIIAAEIKKTIR